MNKRSKEIEEAMNMIDDITLNCSEVSVDAWNVVYEYIKELEFTIQQMIATEERKLDDGK